MTPDPIRTRLDEAQDEHCLPGCRMDAALRAVLDLCDWTQHPDIPVAPYDFVDMVRRAIAEKIGVES
jgi:hypothetical protein